MRTLILLIAFAALLLTTETFSQINVALGKNAKLSSIYNGPDANGVTASRVVDGNTSGDHPSDNSIAISDHQANPWIEVDLGKAYDISSIKVFNRTDAAPERLDNFSIAVSMTPFSESTNGKLIADKEKAFNGPSKTFTTSSTGRYVRLTIYQSTFLQIAELEVYGTPSVATSSQGTSASNPIVNSGSIKLYNDGDYHLKVFVGKDQKEHDETLLQRNHVTLKDIPIGTYISFKSVNANGKIDDDATQARPMYVWTLENNHIYNIRAQDGITDRQNLIDMDPNLKGVDLVNLNPMAIYSSLSRKSIFESMEGNTSRDYVSEGDRFIKVGFDYRKDPKAIGDGQMRMLYQSESLKRQWSVNVDLSGSGPVGKPGAKVDLSGGAKVGYKEYDNTYRDQKDIYAERNEAKGMYSVSCDPAIASLSAEFKQAINSLPLTYNENDYKKVVENYGTHYLEDVTYGGFYNVFLTMSESAYTQLKGNSLDIKANVGVHMSSKSKTKTPKDDGTTKTKYNSSSAGGDLAVGYSKSVDEEFNDLSSQMKMGYSYGGGNGDFDNWELVDEFNAVPIYIKPKKMSDLIAIEVFKDNSDPVKLATIKTNMEKYLGIYLAAIENLEPIPAPPVTYNLEILDFELVEYIDNGDAYHGMDFDVNVYSGPLEKLKTSDPKILPRINIAKGEMHKKVLGIHNEHPDKLDKSRMTVVPKIGLVINAGNPEKRLFKIIANFREGNSNFAGQAEEYTWINYINPDLDDVNKTRTTTFNYYGEEWIWGSRQVIDIKVTYRLTRESEFHIPIGLDVNKPVSTTEKVMDSSIENMLSSYSDCTCGPKTFKSSSDHTWVEFRLPSAPANESINIDGGAYNKYVFPKCNRVWWENLRFTCNPTSCQWEKIKGNWDADALCHGGKGDSPYVFVGDKD